MVGGFLCDQVGLKLWAGRLAGLVARQPVAATGGRNCGKFLTLKKDAIWNSRWQNSAN